MRMIINSFGALRFGRSSDHPAELYVGYYDYLCMYFMQMKSRLIVKQKNILRGFNT